MTIAIDVKEVEEVNEGKDRSQQAGPIRKYGDLLVYKQSYRLALAISKITKSLPREEQFELGRQLRRSGRSVPANIVEVLDQARFGCGIQAPPAETRFWIELTVDEGLANRKPAEDLLKEYSKLGFMIHNLWKEWRKL